MSNVNKNITVEAKLISPPTYYFFLWRNSPKSGLGRPNVQVYAWHAITHTHTGRTPLDEWSTRRRGRHLLNKYKTQPIHALSGAQTRGPGNQAAADSRLRPQGHLVWLFSFTVLLTEVVVYW